jgi:hypothetical protein
MIHGHWSLQNHQVGFIWEEGLLDRVRRWSPASLPGSRRGAPSEQLRIESISDDDVSFILWNESRYEWTRDRGD